MCDALYQEWEIAERTLAQRGRELEVAAQAVNITQENYLAYAGTDKAPEAYRECQKALELYRSLCNEVADYRLQASNAWEAFSNAYFEVTGERPERF